MTSPTPTPNPSPSPFDTQVSNVAVSVCNPRLIQTDPASIRTFLKEYDQYSQTVISRAKQLQSSSEGSSTATTEAVLPMELKYFIDSMHFTMCIDLGFKDVVISFEVMIDRQLRTYLECESKESKDAVTLEGVDELVERN